MTVAAKRPVLSSHHWQWCLEVENDFRNSRGCIKYTWYSALAVFFEASWVAGPPPLRVLPEHRIRVLLSGQEIGCHYTKEAALEQIRNLLEESPPSCKEEITAESRVLFEAINGSRREGGSKKTSPGIE